MRIFESIPSNWAATPRLLMGTGTVCIQIMVDAWYLFIILLNIFFEGVHVFLLALYIIITFWKLLLLTQIANNILVATQLMSGSFAFLLFLVHIFARYRTRIKILSIVCNKGLGILVLLLYVILKILKWLSLLLTFILSHLFIFNFLT